MRARIDTDGAQDGALSNYPPNAGLIHKRNSIEKFNIRLQLDSDTGMPGLATILGKLNKLVAAPTRFRP